MSDLVERLRAEVAAASDWHERHDRAMLAEAADALAAVDSWEKSAQDENDRAQELEVRLEAAEARLAAAERVVEAARTLVLASEQAYLADETGVQWDEQYAVKKMIAAYDSAVPARGEARAPEGGSTPPAAIDGLCDDCGGQFSDLAGHKSLGVQTHPWLDKRTVLNISEQEGE